jgi:hypothetical protein
VWWRDAIGAHAMTRRAIPGAILYAGAACAFACASACAPTLAGAQPGVLLQGVADVELWKTDARSALLARNDGRVAPLGRLHLWGAVELPAGLTLYALGEVEGGPATDETEVEVDQAGVRWARRRALVLDAGIINTPVGAFVGRRLSNRNPLVGAPDAYPVTYPLGAQLSGAGTIGRFLAVDWRAAVVSLPVTNEQYTPEHPGARARPAVGAGITPLTGLRIGASWTAGSYLERDTPAGYLDAGRRWHAYDQRVYALDLQASRGYAELWAEVARTEYDVPKRGAPLEGTAGYVEARWTFTPRLYVAARAERNLYPFIQPLDDVNDWIASATDLRDLEAAIGFRPSPGRIVKLSWRRDNWVVDDALRDILPNGYAVAMQLSQSFDVLDLVDRARR